MPTSASPAPPRADNARDLALTVIRDVFGPEQRGAQAAFAARARRTTLDARDRAFAAELAYGTIKMRRLLDWMLAPYLADRPKALPAAIAEILRLGVYQLQCMNGVDAHAAVFETVNLALRYGHRGTAGLVNAILRRVAAEPPAAPEPADFSSPDDYLATRYSLPTWIVTAWRARFGEPAMLAMLAGIDAAPQHAVRANTRVASVPDVLAALADAGLNATPSPYVREMLVAAGNVPEDEAGRWSIQGESAAFAVDLLDPQPGERIIDYCSGRGNKSAQIGARLEDRGEVYSVERDARKTGVLDQTLARAAVSIASVVIGDAREALDVPLADRALVDAPCSGLGILGRHPEARWRKSPDDAARLAQTQAAILARAAERVRPGGRLVYGVCSTDVREGPEIIARFLAEQPAYARAPLPERYAGFARDGDVVVPAGIDGRDGFYLAVLEHRPA